MSKSGHRWDEKVDPSITDGVKLPLINALDGVRIESHLAPRHDLLLSCHLCHPLMEVLNPFRSPGQRSLVHHRVIGNLTGTYPRESKRGRPDWRAPRAPPLRSSSCACASAQPAAGPAVRAASGQGFVHGSQQLLVVESLIRRSHPVLPQVADFLGRPSAKLRWARRASITGRAPGFADGDIGAGQDGIQLADSLDCALQLLVIAQPLAHLRRPLEWWVTRSTREPRRISLVAERRWRSRSRAWMAMCHLYK